MAIAPLFLYGTLRDLAHLEIVAGSLTGVDVQPAALPDHSVRRFTDMLLPVLVHDPGQSAHGIVLHGLTSEQSDRLDFYEDGYDFTIEIRALADGVNARVYIPPDHFIAPEALWSLTEWQDMRGALIRTAAHEVMSYFGRLSAAEVAWRMPAIRARAASRLRAAHSAQDTPKRRVQVRSETRPHVGFYVLDQVGLQHETFAGGTSDVLQREVFVGADAAIVLPYDPVRDRVLLVEQFRMGPWRRGDAHAWHLEPIAGRIDAGETPEAAARREAVEEAGLTLGALHSVAQVYASPGNMTDFFYIFVAITDLPDDAARLGGAVDEGEDILGRLVPRAELTQMTRDFRAANAPLVLAALWLEAHHAALT